MSHIDSETRTVSTHYAEFLNDATGAVYNYLWGLNR